MPAFTRLSFRIGPYIDSMAPMNNPKSPEVRSPAAISRLPYHRTPTMPKAPSHSMSGGSADTELVTFMFVRYKRPEARSNRCRS